MKNNAAKIKMAVYVLFAILWISSTTMASSVDEVCQDKACSTYDGHCFIDDGNYTCTDGAGGNGTVYEQGCGPGADGCKCCIANLTECIVKPKCFKVAGECKEKMSGVETCFGVKVMQNGCEGDCECCHTCQRETECEDLGGHCILPNQGKKCKRNEVPYKQGCSGGPDDCWCCYENSCKNRRKCKKAGGVCRKVCPRDQIIDVKCNDGCKCCSDCITYDKCANQGGECKPNCPKSKIIKMRKGCGSKDCKCCEREVNL